ncbi:MAG: pitrilysin family protein [Bacteroidetes bacterium]|nr:pitrilysin family protein [Bacteroidota bacterium]
MDLHELNLPNGIRLVHHNVPGNVSHCGVLINAGSRDENEKEHGIAHFIEHVIFKGTEKRNVYQVLNRLENVGADLNAYTSKEETCIYASFLNTYYDRTLELMSDILFHSVFPQKELEKEKAVVIEEIRSYKDSPSDQIFDDFEDQLFTGHPLGRNILGTPKNVKKFKTADIRTFIGNNYHTDQIVICSVGNMNPVKMFRLVEKYFSEIPANLRNTIRKPFSGYIPQQKSPKKKIFQTHCVLGGPGYSLEDNRRYCLAFLNNILGGPVMNSRLSIALREKNGLVYHIESNYTPYSDTGIMSIYFGTEREKLEKALSLVNKELDKVRKVKMGVVQLHTARKQLIGQLAISQESKLNLMLSMGKGYLVQNRYLTFEEIVKIIESITAEQLLETANEILDPGKISMLTFLSS